MRRSNTQPIKEVLEEYINALQLQNKLKSSRISQLFKTLAGKKYASHIKSVVLKEKRLFVFVNSSILKTEFQYLKSHIIQSINREMDEEIITDIVFMDK